MWQRFTEKARKIVFYAQEEAGRVGQNYVNTEHLLLGLLHDNGNLAQRLLGQMGVDLQALRAEVNRQVVQSSERSGEDMQLTPRAKRVIDLAYDEARELNNNYIGTEHLLLGLVREEHGLAARVLSKQGITMDGVRAALEQYQQDKPQAGTEETDSNPAVPDAPPAPESSNALPPLPLDLSEGATAAMVSPIATIAVALLRQALREGARDIHLEPGTNVVRVRQRGRADGVLRETTHIPRNVNILGWYLAVAAQTITPEFPQGMIPVLLGGAEQRIAVRSLPTTHGNKLMLTVLAQGETLPAGGTPSQRMAPPPGLSPLSDILTEHALRGRDILGIEQLTREEILLILDVAARLKQAKFDETQTLFGKGQTLAMLFEKPSLRTRVTFEAGMTQLGGHAIYLEGRLGERETVPDVARNLERWIDGIMARTFAHQTVVELAEYASIPVVNGLSDREHPCQALADFQTLAERKGALQGLKLAYVGDGNNVAHSLALLAAKVGTHFSLSCPEGYEPDAQIWQAALACAEATGAVLTLTHNPAEGVAGADAVYTDVWASMGQEAETAERAVVFAPFQVNTALMAHAKPDAIVMHCLPAHRGEEISAEVLDGPQSAVFDQAENRLHAQKAVLSLVL